MPIYEYKCDKCGHKSEQIVKYDEQIICLRCGYVARKLPSLSNFHLKGGGWAKEGYSKKGK